MVDEENVVWVFLLVFIEVSAKECVEVCAVGAEVVLVDVYYGVVGGDFVCWDEFACCVNGKTRIVDDVFGAWGGLFPFYGVFVSAGIVGVHDEDNGCGNDAYEDGKEYEPCNNSISAALIVLLFGLLDKVLSLFLFFV